MTAGPTASGNPGHRRFSKAKSRGEWRVGLGAFASF